MERIGRIEAIAVHEVAKGGLTETPTCTRVQKDAKQKQDEKLGTKLEKQDDKRWVAHGSWTFQ